MHETSIVQNLISLVETELTRRNVMGRVSRLYLRLGDFSCTSSEALEHAFDMMSQGTRVEGAELRIQKRRPAMQCFVCGAEFSTTDAFGANCPKCGAEDLTIESDEELVLDSIEIEEC